MNSKSKQITITRLEIGSFKGISIYASDLCDYQLFKGANATGKTTKLDAILWCLSGADIKGNKDEKCFIPNNQLSHTTLDTLVDVSVYLSTGAKITRQIVLANGKRTTKVYINELEIGTLKEADALILKELGLLELSLPTYIPTKISIIQLLLNPLYLFDNAKKDLRELVIKQIDSIYGTKIDKMLNNESDLVKSYVNKYLTDDKKKLSLLDSMTALYDAINKDTKNLKKVIDNQKVIIDYLKTKELNDLLKQEQQTLDNANKELIEKKQDLAVLDKFLLKVNMFYQTCSKELYKDLSISLIEKGVGEDVYIETMTPYLTNGTPLYNASESEKIIATIQFVNQYLKHCGKTVYLPVLVDELESVDVNGQEKIRKLLNKMNRQLIGTVVC